MSNAKGQQPERQKVKKIKCAKSWSGQKVKMSKKDVWDEERTCEREQSGMCYVLQKNQIRQQLKRSIQAKRIGLIGHDRPWWAMIGHEKGHNRVDVWVKWHVLCIALIGEQRKHTTHIHTHTHTTLNTKGQRCQMPKAKSPKGKKGHNIGLTCE